ncbi:MAG: sugar ABC transporter substrate-binding protein [Solirubrobacterales bacterium]|nr:sugar ABC transporter substrate-binding protein [Solirubrobacterales bacterium]
MLAIGLIAIGSLTIAACGSDDSGNSGGSGSGSDSSSAQAKAKEAIAKAQEVPAFTLDAPKIDLSKIKGKTIFNIPLSSAIPFEVEISERMKEIATDQGLKWIEYPNQGTPTEWASGISQAIQQKVDLIILSQGIDPKQVIPQLKAAKSAGIPVLVTHTYQEGQQTPAAVADLIAANANAPFEEAGRLQSEYAIAQDGCDIKPVIVNAPDIVPSEYVQKGLLAGISDLCPDVEPKVIDVNVTEWATKIQPEVQSALTQDPDINWVLTHYDSMTIPATAGIRAAGKTGQVGVTGFNGTTEVLKMVQDGTITADVGESTSWLAYASIDQGFRVLGAGPVIEDGNVGTPLRLFDSSNIDEAGNPPKPGEGYGDAYVEGYEKLWGLR